MSLLKDASLVKPQDNFLTRGHVLFTSLIAFFAASLYLLPRFPFDRGLCVVALVSGVLHTILFLFFRYIPVKLWNIVNLLNTAMLGFALHYSGGIMSPFSLFLVFIFISGAAYGIHYPLAVFSAVMTFLIVILVEYLDIFPPLPITPHAVYACGPLTLLIVLTITGHMYTAGSIYRVTVSRLRQMLEKEQSQNEAMIKELSRLEAPSQIGRLVAKITHDIRGPLGAFKGLFELLHTSPEISLQNKEDCALMIEEVDRVAELLGHMMKYVTPGGSTREDMRLTDVVETVVSVLQFHPSAKSIQFMRRYNGLEWMQIKATKAEIQQICFNLLKNSADALDKRPCDKIVEIHLKREDSTAVLAVRDNGNGIPKNVLERLGQRSITTKAEGAGIGLLIVREILEAYGGKMQIDSVEGIGTQVTLSLPLSPKSAQGVS